MAVFASLRDTALARAQRPLAAVFFSSCAGGALLAAGGALVVAVVGGSPALAAAAPGVAKLIAGGLFPVGLSMILFSRSDLLTTAFSHLALPHLLGDSTAGGAVAGAPPPSALRPARIAALLATVFAGNLAGSVAVAAGCASFVFLAEPMTSYAAAAAAYKASLPFSVAFARGVACTLDKTRPPPRATRQLTLALTRRQPRPARP